MIIYATASEYIGSKATLKERIAAIDEILSVLLLAAATSAADDNINEYWFNDGQAQIKTIYKGAHNVERSIMAFQRLRNMYANQLNGRMVRLMDSKNFIGR